MVLIIKPILFKPGHKYRTKSFAPSSISHSCTPEITKIQNETGNGVARNKPQHWQSSCLWRICVC